MFKFQGCGEEYAREGDTVHALDLVECYNRNTQWYHEWKKRAEIT